MTQAERNLRTAVQALDARFEEAGWSDGNMSTSAMRFAAILMNGIGSQTRPSRVDAYLASRLETENTDLPAALLSDMSEAHGLTVAISTLSMQISNDGIARPRELLATDLAMTERAIADVGRAIELFDAAGDVLSGDMDETETNRFNASLLAMRQEFTRLGESADALSQLRRNIRGGVLG